MMALDARARVPQRIWGRVAIGDCWVWTGARNAKGYGVTSSIEQERLVHRAMYRLLVGPIPDGYFVDHLCRNPSCCNPAHLEPVTPGENTRRGLEARGKATHCKRGHKYTAANTGTYVWAATGGDFSWCRACKALRAKTVRPG